MRGQERSPDGKLEDSSPHKRTQEPGTHPTSLVPSSNKCSVSQDQQHSGYIFFFFFFFLLELFAFLKVKLDFPNKTKLLTILLLRLLLLLFLF